jgi:hypothetical protein
VDHDVLDPDVPSDRTATSPRRTPRSERLRDRHLVLDDQYPQIVQHGFTSQNLR